MSDNQRTTSNDVHGQKKKHLGDHRPNSLQKIEVINSNNTKGKRQDHVFANITHKNSSGANNWATFSELLQSKNNSKKPLPTKNKVLKPPQSLGTEPLPSKFNRGKPYQRSAFRSPTDAIVTNVLQESKVTSKHDISTPKLTKHIAMDCEMVGVDIGVNKNMLARISLVNSHGECIMDKFVKPTEPILDYRTRVSGVRPEDLENAIDFKTVQREVADILKGRILVGHALRNDLKVLYLSHPKHTMRDTSKFKKIQEGRTPALKKLAKKYLGVSIQEGEHSSVQDALAAMQLYKMFKKEWETSIHLKKRQLKKYEKNKPLLTSKESVAD